MTDNVIEKLIEQWKGAASQMRPEQGHPVVSCAETLHEWTRPEQFMPSLEDWPEDAEWCVINQCGSISYCYREPRVRCERYDFDGPVLIEWSVGIRSFPGAYIDIPIGIDWRLLKVSRQQMEVWEAER